MVQPTFGTDGGTTSPWMQYVDQIASALHWNPMVVEAQLRDETGNFTSYELQTDNNFAGIKYAGTYTPGATPGGKPSDGTGGVYAHYANLQAGAQGYIDFVRANPKYANVSSTQDPAQEARLLQQDGWATDPNYANKLIALMNSPLPANTPSPQTAAQNGSSSGAIIGAGAFSFFQGLDQGMKMSGFDITNPMGSVLQDGQALAFRAFLFVVGLLLIIFGLLAVVKEIALPGGAGSPAQTLAEGGNVNGN